MSKRTCWLLINSAKNDMCVADELKKALKVYSFEFFAIQIKTINLTLVQNEQFCHLYQTLLWLTMIHTKTAVTLE